MAQVSRSDTMQELIVQAEKRGLLDAVDALRRLGLGNSIDLPQLILVGNQCAAKTSVLEAITGARLTTQEYNKFEAHFATEMVLRTSSTAKVVVEIHTESLLAFGETSLDKDDLARIIHEAKRHWTIGHGSNTPSSEAMMRIEISGPDVPQLTLIDLPGFPPSNLRQPSPQDSLDMKITERYMSQENSIILAIIQAPDESQADRRVMKKVTQHDPSKSRTLGIITEPETLREGSMSERKYVVLARNQNPALRLARGYHVLCNRARKTNDLSRADRDEAERAFFQQSGSAWSAIPANDREVDALREKLGRILAVHIQEKLPYLVASIQTLVKQREQDLLGLGGPRASIRDQRKYLTTLTSQFHDLAGDAIRGNYSDQPFFGGMCDNDNALTAMDQNTDSTLPISSRIRKLRALIRDANRAFHFVISTNGARRQILWPEGGHHHTCTSINYVENVAEPPQHLRPFIAAYKDCSQKTTKLKLTDLEAELSRGTISEDLALDLFLDQSKPWEAIARRHLEIVLEITRRFTEDLATYFSNPVIGGRREAVPNVTAEMLGRNYIDPYFTTRKELMAGKLSELLRPYKGKGGYRGNLGGGSGEFASKVDEMRKDKKGVHAHRCCAQRFGAGMGKNTFRKYSEPKNTATKEAVINMQVYYDISLSTFVDNVKLLAIEDCLIKDIPDILTPDKVLDMNDDMVHRIAAESPRAERLREDLRNQLEKLQKGLGICQKHRPRQSVRLSHLFSQDSMNLEDMQEAFFKDHEQTTQDATPKVLAELTATPVMMYPGPTRIKGELNAFGPQQPEQQIYRPYRPLAVQPPTTRNPNTRMNSASKKMPLHGKVHDTDIWDEAGPFPQPGHASTKPLTRANHFKATTFGPHAAFHLVSYDGESFTPQNSKASRYDTINSCNEDGMAFLPQGLLSSEELIFKDQDSQVQPHTLSPRNGAGGGGDKCPYPADSTDYGYEEAATTQDSILAPNNWEPLGGAQHTASHFGFTASELKSWTQPQNFAVGDEKYSREEIRLASSEYGDGTTAAGSEDGHMHGARLFIIE